jgi:hypothetical protein
MEATMRRVLGTIAVLVGSLLLMGMSGWTPAPSTGGGGAGYDPDSLWFYRGFGDSLTINDKLAFIADVDSLDPVTAYDVSTGYEEIALQDNNMFNVYTNYAPLLLQVVSVAVINSGPEQDFNIKVYSELDLGGNLLVDTTITLSSNANPQSLGAVLADEECPAGNFSVEIDGEAFMSYTLLVDSLSNHPTLYAETYYYPLGGPWTNIPDVIPYGGVFGLQILGIRTEVAVVTASDSAGVETTQMSVDTLAIGPVVLSCPMGDSLLYVDGVPTLTDTCWTSSGDMFVVVNGMITEFVSTP